MAEALISRRGGGGTTIKFENYSSLKRENASNLSEGRSLLAATANENYALFAGGYDNATPYSSVVDAYDKYLIKSTPTNLRNANTALQQQMLVLTHCLEAEVA